MKKEMFCIAAMCLSYIVVGNMDDDRTLAFRVSLMRHNKYSGEWVEERSGERCVFSFATNGIAVFKHRAEILPLSWKSDGTGNISLIAGVGDNKRGLGNVRYIPETDVMDIGVGGNLSRRGFAGKLVYKSPTVSQEAASEMQSLESLKARRPTPDTVINRAAEYERLLSEKDPCLKTLSDWEGVMSPEEILSKSVLWETADLEYPRITMTRPPLCPDGLKVILVYGASGKQPVDGGDKGWVGYLKRSNLEVPEDMKIGMPRALMKEVIDELRGKDIFFGCYAIEYQEAPKKWSEYLLSISLLPQQVKEVTTLLKNKLYLHSNLPRHYTVKQVPSYQELLDEVRRGSVDSASE